MVDRTKPKEALLKWVDAQLHLDVVSKALLHRLALYADAEGRVWAKVPLLASHLNVSERTIQLRLRALEAEGTIATTGDCHVEAGRAPRRVPIYQIAPDEAFETRPSLAALKGRARAATGENSSGEESAPQGATGENSAPVGPASGEESAPVFHPNGCSSLHPYNEHRGTEVDAVASTKGDDLEELVDRLIGIWCKNRPAAARADVVRARVREGLQDAIYADGPYERIEAAVLALLAATDRKPTVWLHTFLGAGLERHRDRPYLLWLSKGAEPAAAQAKVQLPPAFADAEIRELAVQRWGEAFVGSHLDGATWHASSREIVPRTVTSFERLRRDLRSELIASNATLVDPRAAR